MNEIKIFENKEFGKIRSIEDSTKDSYMGFYYILEYGQNIKIGSTKQPYTRMLTLKRNAEKYGETKLGRVALSVPHTNYRDNEKILHQNFSKYRKVDTELFKFSFEDCINLLQKLTIEYCDDTNKIEEKADNFCSFMKSILFGGELK